MPILSNVLIERSNDKYNRPHLADPQLRALMEKVEVVENQEFTRAYDRQPQQHLARVRLVMDGGKQVVGEAGRDQDDLSANRSDAQIAEKFRVLTEDV